MTQSKKRSRILRGAMVAGTLLLGAVVVYPCASELLPMGTGSLEYSREWSARLRTLQSAGQAQSMSPEVRVRTFSNGDWLAIVSANSHGNPWGGTVVTKDNHGVVRSFYGHVCGQADTGYGSKTLDDVYRRLDHSYADAPGKASPAHQPH